MRAIRAINPDFLLAAFAVLAACLLAGACGPGIDVASLPPEPELFVENMPKAAAQQITELKSELDARPASAPRNGKLGMALQAYGFDSQASVYYQRANMLDPSEFRWAFYLGMTRERTGDANGALAAYLAANQIAPEQLTARRKLAEQLMALNRLEESEKVFEESLAAVSDDIQTLISFGRLLLRQQRFAEAQEVFDRANAAGDKSGQAYQGLATAARGLGDEAEAERNLRLYEKHKDEYAFADPLIIAIGNLNRSHFYHEQRAKQFLARKQPEAAIREYQAALEKEPNSMAARSALMQLLAAQRDLEGARKLFAEGKVLNPDSAVLHAGFGLAQARAGNAAEAISLLQTSVRLDSENAMTRLQLGQLLEGDSQPGLAELQYRAILRFDPSNSDAHYMLGRQHLARNDFEEARQAFIRASAAETARTPLYLRALAGTQAELGRHAEAERTLRQALTLLQDYPDAKLGRQLDNDLKRLQRRARQGASQ